MAIDTFVYGHFDLRLGVDAVPVHSVNYCSSGLLNKGLIHRLIVTQRFLVNKLNAFVLMGWFF